MPTSGGTRGYCKGDLPVAGQWQVIILANINEDIQSDMVMEWSHALGLVEAIMWLHGS